MSSGKTRLVWAANYWRSLSTGTRSCTWRFINGNEMKWQTLETGGTALVHGYSPILYCSILEELLTLKWIWIIWPIFSSSVMRLRRSFTRTATGLRASLYGGSKWWWVLELELIFASASCVAANKIKTICATATATNLSIPIACTTVTQAHDQYKLTIAPVISTVTSTFCK